MEFLTSDNLLTYPLWIDLDNASTALQEKIRRGEISAADGVTIQNMIYHGFAMIDLNGVDQIITALDKEMEDLWHNPPFDIAFAGPKHDKPVPMDEGLAAYPRSPGVRLLDIHSHSASARQLYLNPQLHHLCSLILDGQAIATQTLYFEYGSTQRLHRDPWYVNHSPRTHLFAVWIALEDIHPDSGPLNYVTGSHKLPFYRFHTNDIVFHDPRLTQTDRQTAFRHMQEQIRSRKNSPVAALPKRGQAFLWHGSLIHGGSPVINPTLTRRSLVIHFGRSDTHHKRSSIFTHQNITRLFSTEKKYTSPSGELGWFSPLEGVRTTDFGEPKQTVAAAVLVKPVVKHGAEPQHCNICGGSAFGPGPKGRKAMSGKLPQCLGCQSLEIQRMNWTFFSALPKEFFSWRSALQIGEYARLDKALFARHDLVPLKAAEQGEVTPLEGASQFDFITASHLFEYVRDDVALFEKIAGMMTARALLHVCFASPGQRSQTVHFQSPAEASGVHHRYGSDLLKYFICEQLGLNAIQLDVFDSCTDSSATIHLFLRDKIDTLLLMALADNCARR